MNRLKPYSLSLAFLLLMPMGLLLNACSDSSEDPSPKLSISVPPNGYELQWGDSFSLTATASNAENARYEWLVNNLLIANGETFSFTPEKTGTYTITVRVNTESGSDEQQFSLTVSSSFSAYINQVFDYQYAPGQHANTLAKDKTGTDFIGKPWENNKSFTSLGGWGGYIVAGFDHRVPNYDGADLALYAQPGAGSEPAIVWVMKDENNDGQPNDQWYELKGSEWNNPETIRNYQVTYFQPETDGFVRWSDNQGNQGELTPVYTSESWWWVGNTDATSVTFTGTKLPDAYYNDAPSGEAEHWIIKPERYTWGYGECYHSDDFDTELQANRFELSNAIDADGVSVQLDGIDFIKVQSAVFQIAGWLNEISPEVSGAADLHLLEGNE